MNIIELLLNKECLLIATLDTISERVSITGDILKVHTLSDEYRENLQKYMSMPLPTTVYREGFAHEMNSANQFHCGSKKPSIKATRLGFYWGDHGTFIPDGKNSICDDNRENWPIEVVFSGLRMWHHEDLLHRKRGDALICDNVQIRWNNSTGRFLSRENGPITIHLEKLICNAKLGKIINLEIANYNSVWVKPGSSRRVTESAVHKIINETGIDFDPLSLTSCFKNDTDEFVFWSEFM